MGASYCTMTNERTFTEVLNELRQFYPVGSSVEYLRRQWTVTDIGDDEHNLDISYEASFHQPFVMLERMDDFGGHHAIKIRTWGRHKLVTPDPLVHNESRALDRRHTQTCA